MRKLHATRGQEAGLRLVDGVEVGRSESINGSGDGAIELTLAEQAIDLVFDDTTGWNDAS